MHTIKRIITVSFLLFVAALLIGVFVDETTLNLTVAMGGSIGDLLLHLIRRGIAALQAVF